MNSRIAVTLSAVALASAGGGILLATSSGAQATGPTTLSLLQKDDKFAFVDAPPKGGESKPPSAGDAFLTSASLLDPSTKTPVGRTQTSCQVTLPGGKAVALCTGALVLKGGTLVVSGPSPFTASKVTSAVVGGTGAYAGARGTLLFEDSSGDFAKVTVTLLP